MKAFVFLVISIAISVISCERDICLTPFREECNLNEKLPTTYPDTVEELKRSCNDLQDLTRCYLNYYENCPEPERMTTEIKNYMIYLQEKCQEDSNEFQVISSKLDCFTPEIRTVESQCMLFHLDEKDFEKLESHARSVYDDNGYYCLEAMWEITCISRTMGRRCGSAELTDVLSDIQKNTNYHYIHSCKTENLSGFLSFRDAIEQVYSEKKWLTNAENAKNAKNDEDHPN